MDQDQTVIDNDNNKTDAAVKETADITSENITSSDYDADTASGATKNTGVVQPTGVDDAK